MRKWSTKKGICFLLVIGLIAAPTLGEDLLSNGGFELDEDPADGVPDGWTLSSLDVVYQHGSYYFWVDAQGRLGVVEPRTGDDYLIDPSNDDLDWGTAEQTIPVPEGPYDLALSFHARVWSVALFPSSVVGELVVDGEVVAAATYSGRSQAIDPDSGYVQMHATWKGMVQKTITVRISLIGDGEWEDRWAVAVVDDVELWSADCGTQHEVTALEVTGLDTNVVDLRPVPAEARVRISGAVTDGDTIELDMEVSNRVYEFDTNGSVTGLNVPVDVSPGNGGTGKDNAKDKLAVAINLDGDRVCSAVDLVGEDDVLLTWLSPGGHGRRNTNNNDENDVILVERFQMKVDPGDPTPLSLTLSGSNLDSVTALSLRYNTSRFQMVHTPSRIIAGAIQGASDNTLTATFPTLGAVAGLEPLVGTVPGQYDLLVEQTGGDCNPRLITNAIQIIDPSSTPDLLVNSGFEVVDAGNAQVWQGDYMHDRVDGYPISPYWIDGIQIWANSGNEGGTTDTTQTWQTVPVADGSPVSFVGYVHCFGAGASTGSIDVRLWDAAEPGVGIPMDEDGVVQNHPGEYGDWAEITLGGTPSSGYVTVELATSLTYDASHNIALAYADGFTLTVTPACTAPLAPSFAYPSSVLFNIPDMEVAITGGVNLDEATGVRLVDPDAETSVSFAGEILDQTPTALTARFLIADASVPAGTYNVVVEKENCPVPSLDNLVYRPYLSPSYQPNIPATFAGKFTVFPSILRNHGFDDYGDKTEEPPPPPPLDDWVATADTHPDAVTVYNGDAHPPAGGPAGGPNYGSIQLGGSGIGRAVQTVGIEAGRELTLAGYISGYTEPTAGTHYILIRDGGDDGPVLADFTFQSGAHNDLTAFTLVVADPPSSTVTIEWGFIQSAGWQYVATHVDELVLTQEALGCTTPYAADADDDGDVDQDDFGVFQSCSDASGGPIPGSEITGYTYDCRCFDVAGGPGDPPGGPDQTVDDLDYTEFDTCAAGPGVPIPAACRM